MQAEVHGRQQNMETGLCQSALPQSGNSEQTPALPAVRRRLWSLPTHSQVFMYNPEIPGTKLGAQDTKVNQTHTAKTLGLGC